MPVRDAKHEITASMGVVVDDDDVDDDDAISNSVYKSANSK